MMICTVILNTNANKNDDRSPHSISFLNTNARSLGPKIQSLAHCFEEKHLDIATVTETWFQSDRDKDILVDEMLDNHSLGILTRDRGTTAANGRRYGGVALVYRLRTTKFTIFPLTNPNEYEVLAAIGKVQGVKWKIFAISCYAPPNMAPAMARGLIEFVSDLVCEAKRTYRDCSIMVCGDFNQWPVNEIIEDHPDLLEVDHGPTRGDRSIDRTFVNFGRALIEYGTLPPLETEEGMVSDHMMAWGKAIFKTESPETVTYKHRPYTATGAEQFVTEIAGQDWSVVYNGRTPDDKAAAYQEVVEGLMDRCFPVKTVTRRKSDPPWVNEKIRRLCMKRRKIYDKEGRSKRWRKLRKLSSELYRKRAQVYLETQKKLLTGPDASRFFLST